MKILQRDKIFAILAIMLGLILGLMIAFGVDIGVHLLFQGGDDTPPTM